MLSTAADDTDGERSGPHRPVASGVSENSLVRPEMSLPTPRPNMPPPLSTVGQLAFAPSTQTTIVTTTTTTTTSFPPFIMKAPRSLRDRDPEMYPLASSPTPRAIKRLKLNFGSRQAYFEEAENAQGRLKEFSEEQAALAASNGMLQHTGPPKSQSRSLDDSPLRHIISPLPGVSPDSDDAEDTMRNRSATPVSMSDANELDSFHRRNRRPVDLARRFQQGHQLLLEQGDPPEPPSNGETVANSPDYFATPSHNLNELGTGRVAPASALDIGLTGDSNDRETVTSTAAQPVDGATKQSSHSTNDTGAMGSPSQGRPTFSRPNPPHINTSVPQDVSLPSPSLSPITAAANMHRPRPRQTVTAENILRRLESAQQEEQATPETAKQPAPQAPKVFQSPSPPSEERGERPQQLQSSILDIPPLLDTFDSMPDQLKTYVMYQLLKRCAKPTLHFVAEAVDPAMRCDFIGRLPLELSWNVLQYLDAKTLCRSAQVSKKWRQIVDSNERAWMRLIDDDGFKIPDGEIERAIREGWGWHSVDSIEDSEKDASVCSSPSAGHSPSQDTSGEAVASATTLASSRAERKRKRKSSSKVSSAKRHKRRMLSIATQPLPWMESLAKAQGPIAYASAAAAAVPNPDVGLRSLQNLHFFKSIYQRHYVMRQSWMRPETKPLHLAFRAHQRHVVTCLQFDNDKILTGSDDTFIDIYNTKTGATRRRLRGHDGGVWALEYLGDMLVSGSTDRSVRVWDMRDGRMLHVFQGHTSTVRCLQIVKPVKVGQHMDGRPIMYPRYPIIITGSRDSTCRVWRLPKLDDRPVLQLAPVPNDAENPYFLRTLQGHSNSVRAIAAYGDTLVSGSYDTFVRVWKISTGECLHRLQGHTSKVYSVVLDHSRNRCISGSMDNMVKVWSLDSGTCLFNLDGHSSLVGLLDLRDDVLVSAAADSTLRVWDPATGQCKHQLTAHTGAITCFLHDGQKIISGSDRTLKMWDTRSGECVRDLLTDLSGVWQIKFDQRRCVAAVQRDDWTYIEVLDFGACRDTVPSYKPGQRLVVDDEGRQISEEVGFAGDVEARDG